MRLSEENTQFRLSISPQNELVIFKCWNEHSADGWETCFGLVFYVVI